MRRQAFQAIQGKSTHIFSESCLEVMPRVGSLLLPSVEVVPRKV